YGIELGVTPPAEVAARVAGRSEWVRPHLIVALYEWGPSLEDEGLDLQRWWVAALDAADPDPTRQVIRQAWLAREFGPIERFAREGDVRHPAIFVQSVVARLFRKSRVVATAGAAVCPAAPVVLAERLTAAALYLADRQQRANPGDFWA